MSAKEAQEFQYLQVHHLPCSQIENSLHHSESAECCYSFTRGQSPQKEGEALESHYKYSEYNQTKWK